VGQIEKLSVGPLPSNLRFAASLKQAEHFENDDDDDDRSDEIDDVVHDNGVGGMRLLKLTNGMKPSWLELSCLSQTPCQLCPR
jgi:hypothetical protein